MTTYSGNRSRSIVETLIGKVETLTQFLRDWAKYQQLKIRIRREREQLQELSAAMLKDIGVDRASAEHEARRRDVPALRH